jgi:hypothetical protein
LHSDFTIGDRHDRSKFQTVRLSAVWKEHSQRVQYRKLAMLRSIQPDDPPSSTMKWRKIETMNWAYGWMVHNWFLQTSVVL